MTEFEFFSDSFFTNELFVDFKKLKIKLHEMNFYARRCHFQKCQKPCVMRLTKINNQLLYVAALPLSSKRLLCVCYDVSSIDDDSRAVINVTLC